MVRFLRDFTETLGFFFACFYIVGFTAMCLLILLYPSASEPGGLPQPGWFNWVLLAMLTASASFAAYTAATGRPASLVHRVKRLDLFLREFPACPSFSPRIRFWADVFSCRRAWYCAPIAVVACFLLGGQYPWLGSRAFSPLPVVLVWIALALLTKLLRIRRPV